MSAQTGIEWTDATWNPWMGCTKVSPGCAHCYMFRERERYGWDPSAVLRSRTKFQDPLRWKEPRRVFTCSWSDFFHPDADAWRPEAWEIIRQTPHHTYQILTKRPERVLGHLPADWHEERSYGGYGQARAWQHVWLGVSIENQRWVERIGRMPAHCRLFVSCEPLLGPVDLSEWLSEIGWVIAGGESGPNPRPTELDWLRALRDQCTAAGVPFFLKQLGGHPDRRGGEAALLDGRTWTEVPA